MRTRELVSDDKLRGGFYSPDVLVDLCLERGLGLLQRDGPVRVLEPAAGDGAFVRGIARHPHRDRVAHIEAVELIGAEASKTAAEIEHARLPGRAVHANVLGWHAGTRDRFDLVLANPPYVRFQFISPEDRQRATSLSAALGVVGPGVSNLWIPVFLLAVERLVSGGAFSVILPAEFLTGVSAGRVRSWLLTHTCELTIDLFKPGSFPAVLQEVLVLSGRKVDSKDEADDTVRFFDHNGGTRTWEHNVAPSARTWTSYLLTPEQEAAFSAAASLPGVTSMGSVARFSVSTVTGANNFFCLSSSEAQSYDLERWSLPLLPRTRYAKGLVFSEKDHTDLSETDVASWLLSFSADKPLPNRFGGAKAYLADGEADGLHDRYKCRVRSPWYRVPVVPAGELLLSKRSNRMPRVIANHAGVVTTDTIYRGQILQGSPYTADDLTASFHNSLTLLTAEVEGRSFGGGVLELVPSEVAALLVPISDTAHQHLPDLDRLARTNPSPDALVDATDRLLPTLIPGLSPDMIRALRDARETLLQRRLIRSHGVFYSSAEPSSS